MAVTRLALVEMFSSRSSSLSWPKLLHSGQGSRVQGAPQRSHFPSSWSRLMEGPRNLHAIEACPMKTGDQQQSHQPPTVTSNGFINSHTTIPTSSSDIPFPKPSTTSKSLRNRSIFCSCELGQNKLTPPPLSHPPAMSTADELKALGNKAIAAKDFDEAV